MSEEEKIAKLELNRYIYGKQLSKDDIVEYISILFNLIDKQQKEIKELNENSISKDKIKEILKKYSEKEDCTYIELIDFVEEIKQLLEE